MIESTLTDLQSLLSRRISQLGLKLEGSPVERYVQMLHRELERKGLKHFRPPCYLTDEWGCPSGEPIIGIPFYLADSRLARLEQEIDGLEDEREIRRYLRHEAGHAFNYAYKLYETPEWRDLFGPFQRPYRDRYRPIPFDRNFVRHIEGWYAQKHPDEDFAETFAVWLTPASRWRTRYRDWPAIHKLSYVDRTARSLGDVEPPVRLASTDITADEMHVTVGEFFQSALSALTPVDVALDHDLPDFFIRRGRRKKGLRPAWEMIREHRTHLINKVEYWTGVHRTVVRALVESIERAAERLQLSVAPSAESTALIELTTYTTTLCMNFLTRRSFIPKGRPGKTSPQPQRRNTSIRAEADDGATPNRDRPRP
ncbi:MAG TPA: hypothetical protein VLM91_15320 [Candidatus Methylomirabilis sp.]|nr:hypothetical protein [Candidatus Methylomirabilis sp.]